MFLYDYGIGGLLIDIGKLRSSSRKQLDTMMSKENEEGKSMMDVSVLIRIAMSSASSDVHTPALNICIIMKRLLV